MDTNLTNELSKKENTFIRISRGPQFKTKGGHFIALISLASIILSVYSLINIGFLGALALLIIGIITFSIILDIHGIEVDTNIHSIRDYKAFLWFRIGEWSKIQDFKSIYLTRENVVIAREDDSEYPSDTYHYYFVKLVDEANKKEIVLAEYNNYYKAQQASKKVADLTGLVYRDFLKRPIKKK